MSVVLGVVCTLVGFVLLGADAVISRRLDAREESLRDLQAALDRQFESQLGLQAALDQQRASQFNIHVELTAARNLILDMYVRDEVDAHLDRVWGMR